MQQAIHGITLVQELPLMAQDLMLQLILVQTLHLVP